MNLKSLFPALLMCVVCFSSCDKETSFENGGVPADGGSGSGGNGGGGNGGGGGSTTGDMRAKVDGVQWVANKVAQGARMNGFINITGQSTDGKSIVITVVDAGVGTYTLPFDNTGSTDAAAYADNQLPDTTAFASLAGSSPADGGGTLTITAIDAVNKKMSGTFSFKAKRLTDNGLRTITEGSFTNITYVTSLTGNTSNSMSVKVGGVLFTPPVVNAVDVFGSITVTGSSSGADRSVAVSFPSTITPGTYTIGFMTDPHWGAYNPDTDPQHATISSAGTLVITEHNTTTNRVKGTFNFTSAPLLGGTGYTLTEGSFDAGY